MREGECRGIRRGWAGSSCGPAALTGNESRNQSRRHGAECGRQPHRAHPLFLRVRLAGPRHGPESVHLGGLIDLHLLPQKG